MNTETDPETAQDTTLTTTAKSRSRNRRIPRRKNTSAPPSATSESQTMSQGGFAVPIGESGEVVQSAWHFGG